MGIRINLPGDVLSRTFYLAGPMTGLPNFGYDAFEDAVQSLWKFGISVVSPHEKFKTESEQVRASRSHEFYMAHALNLLSYCDSIILLPNWSTSAGAVRELSVALDNGYSVYYYAPQHVFPLLEIK